MTERFCGSQVAYETGCRFGGTVDTTDPKRPVARCHADERRWRACPYHDFLNVEHERLWQSIARAEQ